MSTLIENQRRDGGSIYIILITSSSHDGQGRASSARYRMWESTARIKKARRHTARIGNRYSTPILLSHFFLSCLSLLLSLPIFLAVLVAGGSLRRQRTICYLLVHHIISSTHSETFPTRNRKLLTNVRNVRYIQSEQSDTGPVILCTMDGIVSQHQMHYQDHSRPSSSSSSSSMLDHQLAYPPSSQSSLAFQQHYARKESPNSTLQITTGNSNPADHDADEQTAHPSRMQPQFPPTTSDPQSMKSLMTGFSRILTHREQELLNHLDRLKFFLATAPSRWNSEESDEADPSTLPVGHPSSAHPALNRFLLPNSEYVSCVLWGGLYHITGTDIVRALVFRFEAFGRPVRNMKKFEEGVFSDLRNLKPGTDACLEEPKARIFCGLMRTTTDR